jgi:hypothetical protein
VYVSLTHVNGIHSVRLVEAFLKSKQKIARYVLGTEQIKPNSQRLTSKGKPNGEHVYPSGSFTES